MSSAYIIDAVRLPRALIKKTGGAYANIKPVELLATLFNALQTRNELDPAIVNDVLVGCSTQIGSQGANIAKIASLYAGWPDSVSGGTVGRFCCSGLDAINLSASKLMAGIEDVVVAGGVEHLSSVPMFSDRGAWFSDKGVMDKTRFVHMGLAADLLACLHGYSREALDTLSVESHRRAAKSTEAKRFANSLVPVDTAYLDKGQTQLLSDDAVRPECVLEAIKNLNPSFKNSIDLFRNKVKELYPDLELEARHSAANSPALVDGASLLLLASESACEKYDLKPRARMVSFSNGSDEPLKMLTGHIRATEKLLASQNLEPEDIDLWEVNESFASTVLLYQQTFGIHDSLINVNGGAIAMGHPLGATGGNLVSTLLDELERTGKRRGLVSICGGAGVGVASLIERL